MVTASFEVVWGYQICEFFSSKNQSKKSRNFIILSGFFLQFFFLEIRHGRAAEIRKPSLRGYCS